MDIKITHNTDKEVNKENSNFKYLKFKYISLIILGTIIFVIISSLIIYESGNLLSRYFAKNNVSQNTSFNDEYDSISKGDLNIFSTVDSLGHKINGALNDKGDFYDKSKKDSVLLELSTSTASTTVATKSDIQYVIISFDGSRSLPMWNNTRQFAKDMAVKGKPVHFTYFINPIYLITKNVARKVYQPPSAKMGDSLIGYADSEQDVKNRVEQINLAYAEGNEIGSHNVGHFNGSRWSLDQWLQESNSFDSIVANVQKNNPDVSIQPWNTGLLNFVGFRAPELGVNSALYKALANKKYLYDSSGMRAANKYPVKDKDGIWHIGLGIIKMKDLQVGSSATISGGRVHYVLSMDYNLSLIHI